MIPQDLVPSPLPFLILCWLHFLVASLLLVGRWQPASLSNSSKKHTILLLTGQTEVPRLSLSEPVGISAHLCPVTVATGTHWLTWTEGEGRVFPKEAMGSSFRRKKSALTWPFSLRSSESCCRKQLWKYKKISN